MQQTDISSFLQSLRGSQALVVLAYLIVRQGMAIAELSATTGLNDDTVRKAVKALAAKGNLLRQRGAHGREIWMPAGQTLFALGGQIPKTSDSDRFQNPKTSDSGRNLLLHQWHATLYFWKKKNKKKTQNPKTSDSAWRRAMRWAFANRRDRVSRGCGV